MNFSHLKFNKTRFLVGMALCIAFSEGVAHANSATANPFENAHQILRICLNDTSNEQSFSYFIDALTETIETNRAYFEQIEGKDKVAKMLTALAGIRNETSSWKIGTVLSRYSKFLPQDLKKLGVMKLKSKLDWRLQFS